MRFKFVVLLCIFIAVGDVESNSLILENKIVGGEEVQPRMMKYVVSLRYTDDVVYSSGSLITKTHILTCARCVYPYKYVINPKYNGIFVVVGTVKASNGGCRHYIKHLDTHDGYKHGRADNYYDIGLVTLIEPVVLSDRVSLIDLPTPKDLIGTEAAVAGWGARNTFLKRDQQRWADTLRSIKIQIVENKNCDRVHKRLMHYSQLCGQPEHNNQCTSKGDSGSPLVYNNNVLIGILSYGKCSETGNPSVYTNVATFLSYIDIAKRRAAEGIEPPIRYQ